MAASRGSLLLSLWFALFTMTLAGCDDDPASDGGPDADTEEQCSRDDDCDDGLFCNGAETCDPESDEAGQDGCAPDPDGAPCDEDETCDEESDTCEATCPGEPDVDGDGVRSVACGGDDCDDNDASRFPGNVEVCDDECHDEDCDPTTIGGELDSDLDGDGYLSDLCCNLDEDGVEHRGDDCQDGMVGVNPGTPESCNGIDDDCDGEIDEDVQVTVYRDADGDLHGDETAEPELGCEDEAGYAVANDDCDDENPAVHGSQVEICDGIDNDCDDEVDESPAEHVWYPDADGDGFGDGQRPDDILRQCAPPEGYALLPGDCDDDDPEIHPTAAEECDGVDNDCHDGPDYSIAPGNHEDDDDDGYVDDDCAGGDDCNDRDMHVYPGAPELCDGIDNDCDGTVDIGTAEVAWYLDADRDGWGDDDDVVMSCERQAGRVTRGGDCNDASAAVRPSMPYDICNEVDDDCDEEIDEDCICYEEESVPCGIAEGRCTVGQVTCEEGRWSACTGVLPTTEVCNGEDDDCDGETDEGEGDSANVCGGLCVIDGAPGVACDGPDTDLCEDDLTECDGLNAIVCSTGEDDEEVCDFEDNDCDGETDEGCVPPTEDVLARFPWNGFATGSVHAPDTIVAHPLRPIFRWDAVADAAGYRLQLDDSCGVEDFRDCPFDSPEVDVYVTDTSHRLEASLDVDDTPPVGRRYTWRVAACNGVECSAWSEPRYVDVGRMNQDLNGDGYADVVVGAPGQPTPPETAYRDGGVHVYYGSDAGVPTSSDLDIVDPTDGEYMLLGGDVAFAGDLDGDGFGDLVVGAIENEPGWYLGEGWAFVFYGSALGVAATPDVSIENPALQRSGQFGYAVAGVGDLDGDGYADMAVGANLQDLTNLDEGMVYVFHGRDGLLSATPTTTLWNPTNETDGQFGAAIATGGGDVDGDGLCDLVVGAPYASDGETEEGQILVFLGDEGGLWLVPDQVIDNPLDLENTHFGSSVALTRDTNGDGFPELLAGTPDYDSAIGEAYLFEGSREGLSNDPSVVLESIDGTFGYFGNALASAGDLNADGFDDLVIAADSLNGPPSYAGRAYVYLGGATGMAGVVPTTIQPLVRLDELFGCAVSGAGDIDGDGHADLVVGASRNSSVVTDAGAAYVFEGNSLGVFLVPTILLNPYGTAGHRGYFGTSVASLDPVPSTPGFFEDALASILRAVGISPV